MDLSLHLVISAYVKLEDRELLARTDNHSTRASGDNNLISAAVLGLV